MSWGALAAEINKIPPVTRIALGSATVIAVPLILNLMGPEPYLFDWPRITGQLQIYRLYTSLWVPWSLNAPIKWLFDVVMLYRHLKPIEEKSYHRRLPDMVWQFFWSMAAIQILCYPLLIFSRFWSPLLGFIVYLSSRLSPNESISLYGLLTLNVKWFPYLLVAFDMVSSTRMGCGTIAGLIVAQVLFMFEFYTPERNFSAEPTLRRQSKLRAPNWLRWLLAEPQARSSSTVKAVYGSATAPANRGIGDLGQGANVAGPSGYQWGKGRKLGGT